MIYNQSSKNITLGDDQPVEIIIPQSKNNALIELTINSSMYNGRMNRVTIDLNGNTEEEQKLVVSLVNPEQYPSKQFSSVVLDIKLFSSDDIEVTEFNNQPVKLCFSSDSNDKKDNCLSYFSTKSLNWECEDSCLDKEEDNFYWFVFFCGNLFSFDFLLTFFMNTLVEILIISLILRYFWEPRKKMSVMM